MPLITRLLLAGLTPRQPVGIDGPIVAKASSVNQ